MVFKNSLILLLGQNKADYINKILKRVETVNQKATVVEKINEFIENHWYKLVMKNTPITSGNPKCLCQL